MKLCIAMLLLASTASAQITTGTLLEEMGDLARLAKLPDPPYRTIQFSSYDRRSTSPGAPHWFANSDGFGSESIPNFEKVLRAPDERGVGEYLVADVEGPGAIVRGWSAGMKGVWRVRLDGASQAMWEGEAYEFLARRSKVFLSEGGSTLVAEGSFQQEDADYFPIPFAERLHVTWEGNLRDLHFYHLQVRLYPRGTDVRTFDRAGDVRRFAEELARAHDALSSPERESASREIDVVAKIPPGETRVETLAEDRAGAIVQWRFNLEAGDRRRALREVLLRVFFDGASQPQIETPLGDFFGCGPGIHPFTSLPMTVALDGTMTCRFVMPFQASARFELRNLHESEVEVTSVAELADWTWDDRSLYFHAKWRADHDLEAGKDERVMDLPYLVARGQGVLVGVAAILMNPSGVPTPGGNWWGEGDEKIFVDDEAFPVAFGTGSEDYFNYSWSRPRLFDFPYCGQPLNAGPGTSGYISNYRWQIMDAIRFEKMLAFYMELYAHNTTPGLSYARIAYAYARPGLITDHRKLGPGDLVVPPMPAREPVAAGGARGSTFHRFAEMDLESAGGKVDAYPLELASRGEAVLWRASEGDRLRAILELERAGQYEINLVVVERPDGGSARLKLDGSPLIAKDHEGSVSLQSRYVVQLRNVYTEMCELEAGEHVLEIECAHAGAIGLDYVWAKRLRDRPMRIPGAIELESLEVVGTSPRLVHEIQSMDGEVWSGGRQLWVKAREVGDWIEVKIPVPSPGRYAVSVRTTRSWDYGRIRFAIDGRNYEEPVDTFNPAGREVGVIPKVRLGVFTLEDSFLLRATVVGSNPGSEAPGTYFGLDCVLLEPHD